MVKRELSIETTRARASVSGAPLDASLEKCPRHIPLGGGPECLARGKSGYLCLGCCPCDPVLDKTGEDEIRCDYTIGKKHPHINLQREDHGPVVRRASLAIALSPPASPGLPVHFLLLDRKTHNGHSDHSINRRHRQC